ncbi:MAG: DUF6090 family protein [Cyclobacteriaceae bacterium]
MLKDNKVTTYILYAIGEIILVVVGILIAVNIEDWNEKRKNREVYISVLREVQQDLLVDIQDIERTFTETKDKVVQVDHVLRNRPGPAEYQANKSLAKITLRFWRPLKLDRQSFKKLDNFETPREFKAIQEDISLLNVRNKYYVEMNSESVLKVIVEHKHFLMTNTDWFSQVRAYSDNRPLDKQFVTYLVEDPIYMNRLTYFGTERLSWFNIALLFYQLEALRIYKTINRLVGENPISDPKMEELFLLNQEPDRSLEGRYAAHDQQDTLQIMIKDGTLFTEPAIDTVLVMMSSHKFRSTRFDIEFDSLATSFILNRHDLLGSDKIKVKYLKIN